MLLYVLVTVSLLVGSWCADVGLPIHLNHDDQTETDEQIKLEDFFWTGSGDGPPDYLKKVHTGISKGKDIIVKTETIVATVYVEGKNDVDTICLDCTKDPTYLPINYTTTDRRYWLLTVVSGYFRPRDYPLLEDKLAKLYRLAFTRQQSRHLGLTNNNHYSMERDNSTRNKRQVTSSSSTSSVDKNKLVNKTTEKDLKNNQSQLHPILPSHIKMPSAYLHAQLLNQSNSPEKSPLNNTLAVAIAKKDKENQRVISNYPFPLDPNEHQVRVVIHNVTLITEDDIQAWDENPYYNSDSSDKSSRPFANQTELVYTVFVNGKPVLATTAAEDMKLVTESEMSAIMEKRVFMKAEPYLKEPQATPLVPATKSEGRGFFAAISHNPVLVAISSIAILLLLLLLIALLLMTRAKRQRSAEVKRLSSRQGLLIEHQNIHEQDSSRTPRGGGLDDTRDDFNEGVHNMGYEHDPRSHKRHKKPANIDFPQPPASRPSSSGTSTSDSSVYCPINRPNIDLQNMLDEKASRLFDKKKRSSRVQAEEATEPFYTSVARKREKKTKLKQKRRYLSENRVGSIEEKQARSTDSSNSNESIPDTLKPTYDQLEPNEAYNPNNNYHRNKIMQNDVFVDDGYTDTIKSITSPTQAINREIIKALQHGEKSSESGSIGSFLSMASVKSFPRSTLPEPLHRVLEPVSVTYYDHYDDSTILRKPKSLNADPKSNKSGVSTPMVSQSDTPDPGVIGPIVWEIHKKNRLVSQKSEFIDSPIHDPALSRNRYEGLLEGAIQLYSNPDDTIPPLPSNSFGNSSIRIKDTRGKSAIVASNPHRLPRSNSDTRPLTAGPNKTHSNQSTQPPSPNSRAWGSGAPSPLVRPLSAGPFHRPDPPVVDVTRVLAPQPGDRSNLSAAPLIEAIQNELQKFKRENSQ